MTITTSMATFVHRALYNDGTIGQRQPRAPSPTKTVAQSKTGMITRPTFCGRTDIKDATLMRSRKMGTKSINNGLCRLDVNDMMLVYKRNLSDRNGKWNAILTTGEVTFNSSTQDASYISGKNHTSCKFMVNGILLANYQLRPFTLC